MDTIPTPQTVFILDSHGLLYQLFHALPPMSSPMGEPVGAVYGFTREIFALLEKHQPDYLFCAFDKHAPVFRSDIYEAYKANRSAMPEDLRPQIETAKEVLEAFNVPILALDGFEADDILATVARCSQEKGLSCVIVSSDKDCRQLIGPNVRLYNLRKAAFYKEEELFADWGIRPEQVIDFQSLVGDSTDNIPGVAKVGPKTATELLQQFGTLEEIYENIEKVTGKKKEYLLASKELAFLSRRLVTLQNDVPIQVDWNHYSGFHAEKLRTLFQRFGFKSLMPKLDGFTQRHLGVEADNTGENGTEKDNFNLHASNHRASASPRETTTDEKRFVQNPVYHLVDSQEKFAEFLTQLRQQRLFSFDTETAPIEDRFSATSPRYTVLVGMSFAWNDHEAWYLPFRAPLGSPILPMQSTLETLRPILEDPKIHKIGQNLKYDIVVLKNAGVHLQGIAFDTMLADYLLRH